MANEVITRVSADATGFEAGMERVRRASSGFITDQQATARKFDACQQQVAASGALVAQALEEAVGKGSAASVRQVNTAVKSFQKMADTAGKTRAELLRLKATQLGIAETVEPLIAKIEASSGAMHHLGAGTAAARRELFVLAHEGIQGSWKNFMGSLMVLGERIDVLPLLCGPAGIALGALGASAYVAWHSIHALTEQQEKLDRAMALTGNYAALTQGKLLAYSETISQRVGVSTEEAREALLELAKSGRVAGADLAQIAESVSAYAKVSGQSVEEAARQFEQSYGHAGDAARKWAETHHDLTQAQIEQIRVTEQSGDKADAWSQFVQAASRAARQVVLADNHAMGDAYETLGQRWERFWREISGKSDALTRLQDEISAKRGMVYDGDANPFGVNTGAIEKDLAALERRRTSLLDQAAKADEHRKSVDTFASMMSSHDEDMKSVRTWSEKLDDANARARAAKDAIMGVAKAAGKSREELQALGQQLDADLKKTLAHNETLYRPHETSRRAADDPATRYLERLREQGAALQAQLGTTARLTDAQKELARFNQRMEASRKHGASAEEQSLARAQAAIRLQLERNTGLEKELKLREATAKLATQAQQTRDNLREFAEAQAARYAQAPGGRDVDPLHRDAQVDLSEIMRRHRRELDALRKGAGADVPDSKAYQDAVADIQKSLAESLANHERYYADLKRRQGDWRAGATQGIAGFFKDTQDQAQVAQRAVVDTMGRMEDAVAKFVTTGKLGMREFVASALADLSRLALHQALGAFVRMWSPSLVSPGSTVSPLAFGDRLALSGVPVGATANGPVARLASPGVAAFTRSGGAVATASTVHLEVHSHGSRELSGADLRDLQALVRSFVDQRLAQRMRGQGGHGYNQSLGLI